MAKHPAVPIDQIEADFLAAFKRLTCGDPQYVDNKNAMEKGRLKITFSSLADEAGHSRSHICYERTSRYPRIRQMVLKHRDERKGIKQGRLPSSLDIIRQEKRDVERELSACRQKMSETIIKAEKDRREYVRNHEKDQREIAQLREAYESLIEKNGKVVKLVKGSNAGR